MEFNINNEEAMEICLMIAESNLSLSEMGTLINILSMLSGSDDPRLIERAESQEMIESVAGLLERGVIKYATKEGNVFIEFDLEAV